MINSIYFSHCYDALGRDEGISVEFGADDDTDYDTDYDTGLFHICNLMRLGGKRCFFF